MTEQQSQELQELSKAKFSAKILADSLNKDKTRLTTFELICPIFVFQQIISCHKFNWNIPFEAPPIREHLEKVRENPFVPFFWMTDENQEIDKPTIRMLRDSWLNCAQQTIYKVHFMAKYGLDQKLTIKLLEPFLFQKFILSTTDIGFFSNLIEKENTDPHLRYFAQMILSLLNNSSPKVIDFDDWHLPFVSEKEWLDYNKEQLKQLSSARCARIGLPKENQEDFAFFKKMIDLKYFYPLKHIANPYGSWANETSVGFFVKEDYWTSEPFENYLGWKHLGSGLI
jgi:hypothetical protein